MKLTIKGLYGDKVIWINKGLQTSVEKACVLAEELGHYFTSVGDILDQQTLESRKQEKRARNWAYERLVPLPKIVQAYQVGVSNRYELSEFLGVTEAFLESALKRYQEKYGLSVTVDSCTLRFEPLCVLELLD